MEVSRSIPITLSLLVIHSYNILFILTQYGIPYTGIPGTADAIIHYFMRLRRAMPLAAVAASVAGASLYATRGVKRDKGSQDAPMDRTGLRIIVPLDHQPPSSHNLSNQDAESSTDAHVSLVFLFRGRVNARLLMEAFERTVTRHPALSARLCTGSTGLELCFGGSSCGCFFEERELPPRLEMQLCDTLSANEFAANPQRVQSFLYRDLGISTVSDDIIDSPNEPLCKATICKGTQYSVIALSVAHAVGDAFTFHSILKSWEDEFQSPNSSTPLDAPLSERDGPLPPAKLGSSANIGRLMLGYAERLRTPATTVLITRLTRAELARIKALEAAAAAVGTSKTLPAAVNQTARAFSSNDALIALVSNAIPGVVASSQLVSARGTNGVPTRCAGNVYDCSITIAARSGHFHAHDFRDSLTDPTEACPNLPSRGYLTFWSAHDKVQHAPTFGMQLLSTTLQGAHCFAQSPLICTTKYKASADEYVMITSGLDWKQATSLERALHQAGVMSVGLFPFASFRMLVEHA